MTKADWINAASIAALAFAALIAFEHFVGFGRLTGDPKCPGECRLVTS